MGLTQAPTDEQFDWNRRATEVQSYFEGHGFSTWLTVGIPLGNQRLDGRFKISAPNSPHVFLADHLVIRDPVGSTEVTLRDILVCLSHGDRNRGNWQFPDGQNVANTVIAFNGHAEAHGHRKIQLVVACNPSLRDQSRAGDGSIRTIDPSIFEVGPNYERPLADAIRVGATLGPSTQQDVAYAVDELISGGGVWDPVAEKVQFLVLAERPIFNIDQLITTSKINIG